MKLASKVSSLLGKKPRCDDATFGESLNLEQIALGYEKTPDAPQANDLGAETVEDNALSIDDSHQQAAQLEIQTRRPSVLDLDFMRSPLEEIGLVRETETLGKGEAAAIEEPTLLQAPSIEPDMGESKTHTSLPISVAGAVALAPASPIAFNPSIHAENSEPQTTAPSLDGQLIPMQPEPLPSSSCDVALARSLRGDKDTGFIVFCPGAEILEISDKFLNLTGLTSEKAAKMTSYADMLNHMSEYAELGDKIDEASKEKELIKMRDQIAKGAAKTYTWKATTGSGATLEFTNKYTTNHHLVTIVKDVSDEVEKQRILRASLMLGTVGYWTYSFKTGTSSLSEYITGQLSAEDVSKVETQGLISIIHPEDVIRVQREFDAAVTTLSKLDCEFRVVLEHESEAIIRMIGEVEVSPSSGEPEVFIAFLNDLTEDRQRERELSAVKEQSKNKSDFLARMSHEIKTPLNAIVGMTEVLRDEVDNDEARETANFIADAAENLNNILSQTLEHERLSSSEISLEEETVDIAEIIKSTAAMWKKPCADKGLKLNIRISPDIPQGIMLDSSRFRQCLTNLLSNAVKFTESGSITVAAAPMNAQGNNPKLLVAVRDTGIGMNAEAIDNVFKPFQQGDTTIQRRFGGSGLGMSITQRIVEAMDGQIKINSAEGEGSTIAITLPLSLAEAGETVVPVTAAPLTLRQQYAAPTPAAPALEPEAASHALPAETFHSDAKTKDTPAVNPAAKPKTIRKNVPIIPSEYSGFRVLVVEDNPINQAVVRKLLENHITSMDFAFHGEEAIQILETKAFDVILMDIHMPIKDGIETTLEIRNSGKAWADTVIVALTADPDYQQKRVCRNIGMNDALAKPVKRQELLDVMQRVLNERHEQENKKLTAMSA